MVNRVQEADLAVSIVRIAWELQLSGIREIWNYIERSAISDLARAYAREAFNDFRTINNGSASASVFETWFLSERCTQHDKKIVQAMIADYNGYVFDDTNASKAVTAELIAGLGTMPYGKNYLSPYANIIMNDPIFTEVRDRSNANFLWFVKFERSFKETECELHNGSDLSTQDIRHVVNYQSQDCNDGNKSTAEIIQLFGSQEKDQKTEKSGKRLSRRSSCKTEGGNGKGTNVISLQFGKCELLGLEE